MSPATSQAVLFEGISRQAVLVRFTAPSQSSDGGLPLLASVDRQLGLTDSLSRELSDRRRAKSVDHSFAELLRQRVYSIAHGYADGNDAARIGDDPLFRLACGRSLTGMGGLASQPTLSRFERAHGAREVVAVGRALERSVIASLRGRHRNARRITIDLDGSHDPTHGQQPFSFFNGHYDCWCYRPLFGFLSIDAESEQHLFHARLRPGRASEARGVRTLLRRTVPLLRRQFPRAKILVRLDGGFASTELLELFDELRLDYIAALPGNKRLAAEAERHMRGVRHVNERLGGKATLFGESSYAARRWRRDRRVIFKAEGVAHPGRKPRDNLRFVVANQRGSAQAVWEHYIKRGHVENRIKELKHDLAIDRTSSTSYLANQLRVSMSAAAYVLFQALRARLAATELGRALVSTLRIKLLKVGATVKETWRRIVIELPAAHAWKDPWLRAASALGAR